MAGPAALTAAIALWSRSSSRCSSRKWSAANPRDSQRIDAAGPGDLGATLEFKGDEFKELGDIFASVSNQLKATLPDSANALAIARAVAARHVARPADRRRRPRSEESAQRDDDSPRVARSRSWKPATGSEGAGEHVDIIGREIRRLDDVVQGFLKFARPEELTLQPVAPADLADDVLKMIEPEAKAAA